MNNFTCIGDLPMTLSVEDVASYLGISRVGAYNLCHAQGFPSMRIGKRILIPRDRFGGRRRRSNETKNDQTDGDLEI